MKFAHISDTHFGQYRSKKERIQDNYDAFEQAIKISIEEKVDFIILKSDDIEFQVKDSGSGISSDDIIKLTEPFYQANKTVSTKGFGLGLTICKKIIEAHKGHMTIKSKKGKGSIFVLHLPVIH